MTKTPRPFFSIIIPTLNEEKYVPNLLKDLAAQTFGEFEVIVVDGNSEDHTQDVVNSWVKKDERIQLLACNKRNVSAQRNMGAEKGKGKYLVFLDADVRLPKYFLDGAHYHLLRHSYDGWSTVAKSDSNEAKNKLALNFYNSACEMALLAKKSFLAGACLGCKRHVFAAVQGFNEHLSLAEDWDFVEKLLKKGYRFTILHDPYYVFSFRRFRKEGMPHMINQIFVSSLRSLLNEKITQPSSSYPMLGGAYFETHKQERTLAENFLDVFFGLTPANQRKIRTMIEKLKVYFGS